MGLSLAEVDGVGHGRVDCLDIVPALLENSIQPVILSDLLLHERRLVLLAFLGVGLPEVAAHVCDVRSVSFHEERPAFSYW